MVIEDLYYKLGAEEYFAYLGFPREHCKEAAELLSLEENWDSYGGKQIDREAIFKALVVVKLLKNTFGKPWIVPCPDGGVQVEWHEQGYDVEVYIVKAQKEGNDEEA